MGLEWRVFGAIALDSKANRASWFGANAQYTKRQDIYLVPQSLSDYSKYAFGLKLRGIKLDKEKKMITVDKLELKIRKEVTVNAQQESMCE